MTAAGGFTTVRSGAGAAAAGAAVRAWTVRGARAGAAIRGGGALTI